MQVLISDSSFLVPQNPGTTGRGLTLCSVKVKEVQRVCHSKPGKVNSRVPENGHKSPGTRAVSAVIPPVYRRPEKKKRCFLGHEPGDNTPRAA
ncbi:uncharacterized [Tachysurus ichikawai]